MRAWIADDGLDRLGDVLTPVLRVDDDLIVRSVRPALVKHDPERRAGLPDAVVPIACRRRGIAVDWVALWRAVGSDAPRSAVAGASTNDASVLGPKDEPRGRLSRVRWNAIVGLSLRCIDERGGDELDRSVWAPLAPVGVVFPAVERADQHAGVR